MDFEQWTEFFAAVTSASAALAGLVIVAIATNITTLLTEKSAPARAAATISSLMLVLVTSTMCLIPDQQPLPFGMTLLLFSIVALAIHIPAIKSMITDRRSPHTRGLSGAIVKVTLSFAEIAPFFIASGLALTNTPGVAAWISTGIVIVFISTVFNIWVLLVEILR